MRLQYFVMVNLQVTAMGTENVGSVSRLARKVRKKHGADGVLHFRHVNKNDEALGDWQQRAVRARA